MGNKTWLLIADASKARLYSLYKARIFQNQTNDNNLELIGQYTHKESRMKKAELVADRKGEFGTGTFVEETSPKTREAEIFAQELLHRIETGRNKKNFADLILVAPPTFLGILQKHMPHELHKLVSKTIEKDYTQLTERNLIQSLLVHL